MTAQFLKNIDEAKSFLESTDVSLSELTEHLVRAKELAIQAANDPTGGEDSRRMASYELDQIKAQAVQIGNRKFGERYLFGGFKTNQAPFNIEGEYRGDDGEMRIQINKDSFVAMNLPGDSIFLGKNVGDGGILKTSPEIPKNTNELIHYKKDETERLQKKSGDEQQSDDVQLRAPASLSRKPVILHAGEKGSDYKSTGINILETLKDLDIALKVNDKETVQESIDNMDQAINQIVQARAELGGRIASITSTGESLRKASVDGKQAISQLEDADLFHTVSEMQKQDATLKATLETAGKVIQPSLMDFIK